VGILDNEKKSEKKDYWSVISAIKKEEKRIDKDYHSGLVGEKLIVASYKQMDDQQLKGMRLIINKILNDRKISRLQKNVI